jgi:hypothetical protein
MSIQPEGELLRRAVKWLSEQRKYHPEKRFSDLLDEACMKFDLSPKDTDALIKYTKDDSF